jgi:hypothetical protein
LSELSDNRIRATVGKLGVPHIEGRSGMTAPDAPSAHYTPADAPGEAR